MDIKTRLDELKLNPDNAVVIGSGVLNALNLRESKITGAKFWTMVYLKLEQAGLSPAKLGNLRIC